MIVLGVDPGLINTGYGVIEAGPARRYKVLKFGVIRPPKNAPLDRRLFVIHRELTSVIATFRPVRVAIESIYQARNVRSALTLGHARAAALLAAATADVPLTSFAPSTVKAHVSGYGLADKQQVSWMVSRILGLASDLPPGDAADALALALCGADLAPSEDLAPAS